MRLFLMLLLAVPAGAATHRNSRLTLGSPAEELPQAEEAAAEEEVAVSTAGAAAGEADIADDAAPAAGAGAGGEAAADAKPSARPPEAILPPILMPQAIAVQRQQAPATAPARAPAPAAAPAPASPAPAPGSADWNCTGGNPRCRCVKHDARYDKYERHAADAIALAFPGMSAKPAGLDDAQATAAICVAYNSRKTLGPSSACRAQADEIVLEDPAAPDPAFPTISIDVVTGAGAFWRNSIAACARGVQ